MACASVAVEKAAELVFELVDALHRPVHQRPGEILVGQPLAALDRVHEVALDRIAGRERDVVAALDHPRAAAFAEQALHRNSHGEIRVRLLRMQRGKESGAAGAQDEDVGLDSLH